VAPGVGLAMRRLSIIDLETGDQPISNEDGSIWVVFNGEIYNFQSLRQQLEQKGHTFRTRTDTEVIVHAYEEYGDDCISHFNGMFAFALWDESRRRLLLARDRLGIKPLYYCWSPAGLIFGSELKAVIAHPDVPRDVNLQALDQFLTLEYIPTPHTIFSHVHKLPPGHRLIVEDGRRCVEQYWQIPFEPIRAGEEECVARLRELISDAVQLRMIADVPLGAFLSGGIDSSTIVAFMSQASTLPVRTFSVGFKDATYNELPYARMVAERFATDHHEEILHPDITGMAVNLIEHLDEPFADFSIFPTYLISEVARKFVKVVLSGDGGDEIFGGYDTYVAQGLAAHYETWVPSVLRRRALPRLLDFVPPQPAKKGIINKTKRFVEGAALPPELQHTRWMMFMNQSDKDALYRFDLAHELNGSSPEALLAAHFDEAAEFGPLAQQQYVDVKTYLVEDILTKVDRMSMAVSLEARVPLLDHRIVEFALNLAPKMKVDGSQTKVILRRAMADLLPREVLDKPKEGFSIPLKHWLRQDLRPLMMDLLAPDTLHRRGYFRPSCVGKWIEEHEARRANHSHRLWALMVFELWHRKVLEETQLPSGIGNEAIEL
jgi:asparagine synthase (glutamine-hydrolysing)